MKTAVKKIRTSKTSPTGWPTEKEWKEVEKRLSRSKPSKVLPHNASPVDQTKQELCSHFVRYCLNEQISQRELAKILGVAESRVSEITHYHHERFTIDKLMQLLNIIKPKLKMKVA